LGIGKGDRVVHLIDFGLTTAYRDSRTRRHLLQKDNQTFTGTSLYASINSHKNISHSRRDDLESLAYVLIQLVNGSLPWQNLAKPRRNKSSDGILKMKLATSAASLCHDIPTEFITFLNYARKLDFEQKPDYEYLRRVFRDLLVREGYHQDDPFDWCISTTQSTRPVQTEIELAPSKRRQNLINVVSSDRV
jgi:casein kinase I family protein HRR25